MPTINLTIAAPFDFAVMENQTFMPLLTFNDADTGDPISLAGVTAKLSVRSSTSCNKPCNPYDQDSNQIYKQDFYGTVVGINNNQLQFNNEIQLHNGIYKYDLLIVYPSGEKQYYMKGNFKVKRTYTNED